MWEAIGRHFYGMEFGEADRIGALSGNQFIADLGPRYPLYVSMLPADAQAALNRPHDEGVGARDMLLAEDFRDEGYLDIFDGGPTLVADIDAVRTIRRSEVATVVALEADTPPMLAGAGTGTAFRAAIGAVERRDGGVAIGAGLAVALDVAVGDVIRFAP